jgi:hypothetical protein
MMTINFLRRLKNCISGVACEAVQCSVVYGAKRWVRLWLNGFHPWLTSTTSSQLSGEDIEVLVILATTSLLMKRYIEDAFLEIWLQILKGRLT